MATGLSNVNHKTVFLVDRSCSFLSQSCEQAIEFDVFTKNRQTPAGIIPLAAICKSLWTCTVESMLEYARIVWDLYPDFDRLLALAVFHNTGANVLTNWNEDQQNLQFMSTALGKCALGEPQQSKATTGPPENFSLNAIQPVLQLLSESSPLQTQRIRSKHELINRGRVIMVSQFSSNSQITNFVKQFNEELLSLSASLTPETESRIPVVDGCIATSNKSTTRPTSATSNTVLPIQQCELVILNTFPVVGKHAKISEIHGQNISPLLHCSVQNIRSGQHIALRMIKLVLEHYGLSSTTVTGIPMKEEQNASSSANYDVEIVHSNDAHLELLQNRADHPDTHFPYHTMKEDALYETVSLKWCTPKSSLVEFQICSSAHRITAVDVNSRPSSCLINFLLSGRTVMLEMPKLKGKCLSHMLAAHSGELYIHTLNHNRSVLEEMPSISEGCGGRITDYRISDFSELIRKAKLTRCKIVRGTNTALLDFPDSLGRNGMDLPLDRAKQFLQKQTLYWPLTLSHTLMFNLGSQLQPLLNLLPKEQLSVDEVNECKSAVYQIVNMESKSQPLPVPPVACRGRHAKREEMYKLLWKELEQFVEKHATTPEHNGVLNCIRELHNKQPDKTKTEVSNASVSTTTATGNEMTAAVGNGALSNGSSRKFAIVDEAELAWKELERFNGLTEREKSDLSLEPPEKKSKFGAGATNKSNSVRSTFSMGAPLSLFGLYVKKIEQESSKKRLEFKGRQNGQLVASLYTSLSELKPENPL